MASAHLKEFILHPVFARQPSAQWPLTARNPSFPWHRPAASRRSSGVRITIMRLPSVGLCNGFISGWLPALMGQVALQRRHENRTQYHVFRLIRGSSMASQALANRCLLIGLAPLLSLDIALQPRAANALN
jgi:hypothetical protein